MSDLRVGKCSLSEGMACGMFVARSDYRFGSYMICELETACLMGVEYVSNVLG